MNERIKTYAFEYVMQMDWEGPPQPPSTYTFTPEGLSNFAHMIIQDCLTICYECSREEYGDLHSEPNPMSDALEARLMIKERFGIQE